MWNNFRSIALATAEIMGGALSYKTRNRVSLGGMNVEDGIQLGEVEKIPNLPAGIGKFQLAPCRAAIPVALGAALPLSIIISE